MDIGGEHAGEVGLEGFAGAPGAEPGGAGGDVEDAGDVGVRHALDVVEDEDVAQEGREAADGDGGALVGLVEDDAGGGPVGGAAQLGLLEDLLLQEPRLLLLLLPFPAAQVDRDGAGPGEEVAFPAVAIAVLHDSGDGFLGDVLGRRAVPEDHVRDLEDALLEGRELRIASPDGSVAHVYYLPYAHPGRRPYVTPSGDE